MRGYFLLLLCVSAGWAFTSCSVCIRKACTRLVVHEQYAALDVLYYSIRIRNKDEAEIRDANVGPSKLTHNISKHVKWHSVCFCLFVSDKYNLFFSYRLSLRTFTNAVIIAWSITFSQYFVNSHERRQFPYLCFHGGCPCSRNKGLEIKASRFSSCNRWLRYSRSRHRMRLLQRLSHLIV